jgi:hypothetical protein
MCALEDLRRRVTRAQRQGTHWTAAKDLMLLLAIVCLFASAIYWWGVQSTLIPDNRVVALSFTAILVLAPPVLTSFCIPWSPGGMLLQKINARTWGMLMVIACAIYLAYYSFQVQWSWWAAQTIVADSHLIWQQVLVGMIGYIIIPALLWTPVSSEELEEKLRQAQLVKRYELQTQADIAILQATLLRAQQQALVGFANLAVEERAELAAVMQGIVGGIDRTIQEMAGNLNRTVTTVYGANTRRGTFAAPAFATDMIDLIDYVAETLAGSQMIAVDSPQLAPPAPALPIVGVATPSATADPDGSAERVPATPSRSRDLRSAEAIPDQDRYAIAIGRLGLDGWTDERLGKTLGLAQNTARKIRNVWRQAGLVESAGSEGTWKFTEREVR